MPASFYRPRTERPRRAGASVWPPRRNAAVTRRRLAEAVTEALPPLTDADGAPVDPESHAGLALRWINLRNRRDDLKAMAKEAQRLMDETARETAHDMAEQGALSIEVATPSGQRYRVKPKREVWPKYRPVLDDDGDPVPGEKFGRAELFAALRADGFGGLIKDNIDGTQYNALIRRLDQGGEGELTPALARVIEIEPSWGLEGSRVKRASGGGEE